jgi:integrase
VADPIVCPTRQRFADYATAWLDQNGPEFAGSSQLYYANNLAHANVAIGDIFLDALSTGDIRRWLASGRKDHSRATVDGWKRVVSQVLDDAVEDGLIQRNPALMKRERRERRRRRTRGARGRHLSVEQFRHFVQTVPRSDVKEDVARLLLTIAWTGCRIGEALALLWEDYRGDELYVTRSVWRGQVREMTKTGEDDDDPRIVWVLDPLVVVLREQRQWLLSTQHPGLASGLMFPANPRQARAGATRRDSDDVRWYRSATTAANALAKVIAEAKLQRITLHSLRRTIENLDRRAGTEAMVRRASRGWVTEAAQEIYSEVGREDRIAAGQNLLRYVYPGSTK